MPLPDLSGRTVAGKENSATRLTSAVSGVDGATLGASGGAESFTLAQANLPDYSLTITDLSITGSPALTGVLTDIARNVSETRLANNEIGGGTPYVQDMSWSNTTLAVTAGTLDVGGTLDSGGSGTAKGHVAPVYVLNCFLKL